ncbi:MAG: DNA repair protein RecN [Oscillospiraceae bacterium]|jgi:DNA repair protein RecN (Recombination protein N)|nr:DNA repair protein RecN [Oscillospiraceae bacterium]
MLTSLYIQNIAVISKATIQPGAGLNVFTGETGAGKTILISAIDAVLGERTAKDMIRTGEEKAVVTALFEDVTPGVRAYLGELGVEDDEGGYLITRELTASGKSTCRINGVPATAGVLRQVASRLIHIHGQRDSLQLLAPERHLGMLDDYAGHGDLAERYRAAYENMRELEKRMGELVTDERQKSQRIDLLTYQIGEIEKAELYDPMEEEELAARRRLISSSEKVLCALSRAYSALSGDGESEGINGLFGKLSSGVETAAEYIGALGPMSSRLNETGYELLEFASELRDQLEGFEFNPRELNEIELRLDIIYRLKQKYGADITGILSYLAGAKEELDSIAYGEERLAELTRLHKEALGEAESLAEKLTRSRAVAAKALMKGVEEELAFLDMPAVKWSVKRERKALSPDGWDDIAFFATTNVGEEPKPLNKIASGGEVSRMMLAFKNVMADRDAIGTLIFDEVDMGVSGRAAQKIGAKLSEVSRGRQVICVTHLAQVAAFADRHFFIYKEVEEGRTHTRVEELAEGKRAVELARITMGESITETAVNNARELIELAKRIKDRETI